METKLDTKRLSKNKMAEFGASFSYRELEVIQRTRISAYLSRQVFENSCRVDSGCGSDTSMACCAILQVTMDTSNWELIFDDETRD
jgi:hypothetical protein